MLLDSVVQVFAAANAPVNWNLIENFSFDDSRSRELLSNNKYIMVGNMIKNQDAQYTYKTPFYKHLDLFVSRKNLRSFKSNFQLRCSLL
jgi:hypothetical protein